MFFVLQAFGVLIHYQSVRLFINYYSRFHCTYIRNPKMRSGLYTYLKDSN